MNIDVGNNPVGSLPTVAQKTQIRKAIACAEVPTFLGPVAALADTDDFYVYGSNMAYAKNPSSLTSINLEGDVIGKLSLTSLSSLTSLQISDTSFSGVDDIDLIIKNNQSIETFSINSGNIYSLDFSNCTNLTSCSLNYTFYLESLNLDNCQSLTDLTLGGVGSSTSFGLDLTNLTSLEELYCPAASFTALNVSNLLNLLVANFYSANYISQSSVVNLSGCTNLTNFSAYESYGNYDLSDCSSLTTISFVSYASSFNLTNCSSLSTLSLTDGNTLSSLIIDGCTSLISVTVTGQLLSSEGVNDILINLDSFDLEDGYVELTTFDGLAPPTGDGITAAANLVTKGWTVITD
jgi:hypothetical protein